jgi:hypothetical protein
MPTSQECNEFIEQKPNQENQVKAKNKEGAFDPWGHLHIGFCVFEVDLPYLGEIV